MEVFDDRVQGIHIAKSHLDWRHSGVHRSGSAISHQFRLGLYRIQCADDARHIEVSLGITTSLKFFFSMQQKFEIMKAFFYTIIIRYGLNFASPLSNTKHETYSSCILMLFSLFHLFVYLRD